MSQIITLLTLILLHMWYEKTTLRGIQPPSTQTLFSPMSLISLQGDWHQHTPYLTIVSPSHPSLSILCFFAMLFEPSICSPLTCLHILVAYWHFLLMACSTQTPAYGIVIPSGMHVATKLKAIANGAKLAPSSFT